MKARPVVVFLTGAGMSAESGLSTFRGAGGLWENHRIEEVASPEAWRKNRALVLRFYNERRRALAAARPNEGHRIIAELQEDFDVRVVTQNVDDLHERAGSKNILHLHGELVKGRSAWDERVVVEIGYRDITEEDTAPDGAPLRPHIVWFGEPVPMMERAAAVVSRADALVVVGTSLQVYPAASLVWEAPAHALRMLIDPDPPEAPGFEVIPLGASAGLRAAAERLRAFFKV